MAGKNYQMILSGSNTKRAFWIYLLLVHLLLAMLIFRSGLVPRLLARVTGNVVENTHLYDVLLPYHRRQDGSVPDGAIIFLGDSIVHTLVTSAIADKTINYGIGADTVGGLHARIPIYKSLENARAIVLSIGVNDLWYRGHDEIAPLYEKLLSDLPAHIPVVVNALFPVDEGLGFAAGTNRKIQQVNESLERLVVSYPNVLFLSNRDLFIDGNGQLKSDYHIGDGLHLNTKGYDTWTTILKDRLSRVTQLQVE